MFAIFIPCSEIRVRKKQPPKIKVFKKHKAYSRKIKHKKGQEWPFLCCGNQKSVFFEFTPFPRRHGMFVLPKSNVIL